MISFPLLSSSVLVLAGALRAGASFLGCCDDPPDPPQPPPPQQVTNVQVHIDIPDIAAKMKPGTKVIIKVDSTLISATSNLSMEGVEVTGRVEVDGGYTYIYLQNLIAAFRKFLQARGQGGSSQAVFGSGTAEGPTPPGSGTTSATAPRQIMPHPRGIYRHWISPEIVTVPFSSHVVQTIEGDFTPIRFGFSVPFGTSQEFFDAGIENFWVDAKDANGVSVMPADAQLVSTPIGEWPITSRIIWDPADPAVICVSFDLVNADGSMVTPTELGCDGQPITFTFGITTTDTNANWDFGWFAGLWRTEIDEYGTHYGDGGMWLGWHASSFDAIAPINPLPTIVEVADAQGNPTTSVSTGELIHVTVDDGLAANEVEMSVGGRVITTILSTSPGPNPGETVYSFVVPTTSQLGNWSLFFRNLGATPLTNPVMVPAIQPGYDYQLLTIR